MISTLAQTHPKTDTNPKWRCIHYYSHISRLNLAVNLHHPGKNPLQTGLITLISIFSRLQPTHTSTRSITYISESCFLLNLRVRTPPHGDQDSLKLRLFSISRFRFLWFPHKHTNILINHRISVLPQIEANTSLTSCNRGALPLPSTREEATTTS